MESERFDRFAKSVGRHVTRRAALGPLAGLGLASVSAVATETEARRRKRRKSRPRRGSGRGSAGVRLFEELAATLRKAGGDCDALIAAAATFQEQNETHIDLLLAEEAGWDRGQRDRRARRDQRRITAAAESLYALLATCGFRGASPSLDPLVCDLPAGDGIDPPGLGACHGCDCGCICPLTAGECTGMFFACFFGGSRPSCCWFGTCVNHLCSEQCVNCCNCCPS